MSPTEQSPTDGPAWRRHKSRGQSIVEFGLVLPMLLLLMLGTLDLGRAFFDYIQMRNAAYEGARYASRFPSDTTGAKAKVTQHGVPSATTISITFDPSNCCTVDETATVTVSLTHTFTPITTSFLQRFFDIGPWTLVSSASARVVS
ncbi:MAG TPA: TadE/TadG family type IV pilus assembly protein [Thermomicrobiaceae bacterium]|nr:TadE/TadG family type IV pilus assembly protein [Thermomicrobiaceae bacterium]